LCFKFINKTPIRDLLNLLEPEGFVQAFFTEPPENFEPMFINLNGGTLPGFLTEFDLLTTADAKIKRLVYKLRRFLPFFSKINLKPRAMFIGTTVSEYSLFPQDIDLKALKEYTVSKLDELRCQFLIIKDIPLESPILSHRENEFSKLLISYLENNGFTVIYGQALGYVPINFSSTDEYLKRFSSSRRKDLKRKLRSFSQVSIESISTGDDFLNDSNIELLYELYLNVYKKSKIHFDKLTMTFFKEVLKEKKSNGIVFLYRNQDKIIGFNLCYIFRDYLVDKYIGFLYPDSQKFNLYFLSWFHNLNFCIQNNLKTLIVGWTDPEIKAYLGAEFTHTYHAVYIKNAFLRFALNKLRYFFESDKRVIERLKK